MARLVDWYRLRPFRTLAYALVPGMLLLPLGNFVAAYSAARMAKAAEGPWLPLLLLLGFGLMAAGPLWAMFSLFMSLRRDVYLAIRTDGLAVRLDAEREETLYSWESLTQIRYDPAQDGLCLELSDGEALILRGAFAGVTLAELARRIRDARRLAVWNRLVPRFPSESQ